VKPQAEQQATALQHTLSRSLFPLPFSERRLVLMALDLSSHMLWACVRRGSILSKESLPHMETNEQLAGEQN
jgi:hypothetical protein